jgi:hypothetical protein
MFGMIPDFENTNDIPANHRPMTVSEKFVLALHQSFDISAHLGNAFRPLYSRRQTASPITERDGMPTESVLPQPRAIRFQEAF